MQHQNNPASDAVIVIKIGGSTLGEGDSTISDIVRICQENRRIVIVHGGGKFISEWIRKQGIVPEFVRGLRKTDKASLDVAIAVLGGKVNCELVAELRGMGVNAVGLSGVSGGIFTAERMDASMGYVGRIVHSNPDIVEAILQCGGIPVVAPMALDSVSDTDEVKILNVNADSAAGHLACVMRGRKIIFQTDVPGVMDESRRVIPRMTRGQAQDMITSGVAVRGMIPKLEACVKALEFVRSAHIVDGRVAGSLLECIAGNEVGTRIV